MNTRFLQWIVASALIMTILAGAALLYVGRHDVEVALRPGTTCVVHVEIPMQRPGRPKSFAKGTDLPVDAVVSDTGDERDGITFAVTATGHKVHKLWADVRVDVPAATRAGRYGRELEFTIDGVGDWPRATIVVCVE